ncbi:SCO family protein [Streptomyces anthocyanicus]|uniref:Cytochrome oxidase biogenesis protein Sco1/SenC/PrrC, putative copper metallochaperone n=1 Tax=Streptomyces lividans 1326 TaxID=1200984 RepID=A0A7U9DKT1_STRLI|nr:Cytochrome oxidase biogenesis protein Sco1/SenC/PrrC, putative copper metallochaperone [Streptomyces lividans 1326]
MHHRTRPIRLTTTVLATAAAVLLAGCGTSGTDHHGKEEPAAAVSQLDTSPYRGTALDSGFTKPDLVLTDTTGKPFDLRKQTTGKTTLLFFGYTNCPDVCPTTMGDISLALSKQLKTVKDNVRVIFITTDPERDTPKSLGKWLESFGPNFIGLSGDLAKVKTAARSIGISVEEPKEHQDGTVTSDHGAQVAAFLPADDEAHVIYTAGTTTDDYAHDLPLLVKSTR